MSNKNFYTSADSKKNLDSLNEAHASHKGHAYSFNSLNLDDNTAVRPPFGRSSYERFRPQDALPRKPHDIMKACRTSYESVGIIRSVIDLMTEIAVEGLQICNQSKSVENFYKNWAKKVNLQERAERYSSYYLIEGNVVVRSKVGEIDTPAIRKMKQDVALGKNGTKFTDIGVIPLEYLFYDPANVNIIGGDLAMFSGEKRYGIRVTSRSLSKLRSLVGSNPSIKEALPPEIKDYLDGKGVFHDGADMLIPIKSDNLYVDHYKKKDSDPWAKSFIYSILHDVIYNEKLRVAKIAGLDSFYNSVRIWRIGDVASEIFPGDASLSKLANIIENHSGGTMDIIWDDLLQYEDHYPPIDKLHNFDENYESILLGLGVHRSLIGGSGAGSSAGVSNAFVGLRNMMKRIDAVRRSITKWIESEMEQIDRAMGFRTKSVIKFSLNNLFDQQSYFKLIQDLNDRDIISNQSLIEKIGENWDIEKARIKEQRLDEDMPEKKGPFIQPTIPDSNFEKQKELTEMNKPAEPPKPTSDKKKAPKDGGRPPGSKDTVKRNRKFKAKSGLVIFADRTQEKLDKLIDPVYLGYNNISNKRHLTADQKKELERAKLEMLASIDQDFETVEDIEKLVNQADGRIVSRFVKTYEKEVEGLDTITNSQQRMIKSMVYSEIYNGAD